MTNAEIKSPGLAFHELLEYLRLRGFQIGVDHYLRLHNLLISVGTDCAPQDLKTVLCPIFATNQIQQEQFYRVFDDYYDLFNLQPEKIQSDEKDSLEIWTGQEKVSKRTQWVAWVSICAVVILLGLILVWNRPKPSSEGELA